VASPRRAAIAMMAAARFGPAARAVAETAAFRSGARPAAPLVARIDHVYARVDDPLALFETLSKRLGLPRSYGWARVPILEGGAVSIGDLVFIEALRYAPGRRVPPPAQPGLDGLALEAALPLPQAASELSARGLAHTPPLRFSGDPEPFAFAEPLERAGLRRTPGALWSMVRLGGLLGEKRLARLQPLLPRRGDSLPARLSGAIAEAVMSSRRLGPLAVAGSTGRQPTVWLHEFKAAEMQVARDVAAQQLRECGGGELGIERVREVVLAAKDLSGERGRWQRLLDPIQAIDGAWHFPAGPALRLVGGDVDRILALVCDVTSLQAAAEFLDREGMLGAADDDEVRIVPEALQGLDIRLRSAAAAKSEGPPSRRERPDR
jgi:hypothetical protein